MTSISFNSYSNINFSSSNKEIVAYTTTNKEQTLSNNDYQDKVSISIQAREQADMEKQVTLNKDEGNLYTLKYGDLNAYDNMTMLEKARQVILDKRMGLDREKIEEINDKMEAIINDESIPDDIKDKLLENLSKEKEAEYKKAAERTEEQEKSKVRDRTVET